MPKKTASILKRFIASLVGVSMAVTSLTAPAPAWAAFSPETAGGITIPKTLGTIEEFHQAPSCTPQASNVLKNSSKPEACSMRLVVYIQDAHDSLEAQENIAKIISHLTAENGVQTVLEEGFEGEVPTDKYFQSVPDAGVREKVSYFLMDKLRIGGAEYAHINRKREFKLVGADSFKLHKENIRWYQKAAKFQEENRRDLETLENHLHKLIQRSFPRPMKQWLGWRKQYDEGRLELLRYLQRSAELTRQRVNYPILRLFFEIEQTKDAARIHELEKIKTRELFAEIERLEQDIAAVHLKDPGARKIFEYYQTVQLLKRLNRREVSAPEYQALLPLIQSFKTQDAARFLAEATRKSIVLSRRWEKNIQASIKFYETAAARDQVIEQSLKNIQDKTSVLVYGGFHKDRIKEILSTQKFSYLIVAPKITAISTKHREDYRRLMALGLERGREVVAKASRLFSDFEFAAESKPFERGLDEDLRFFSGLAQEIKSADRGEWIQRMNLAISSRVETREVKDSAPEVTIKLRDNDLIKVGKEFVITANIYPDRKRSASLTFKNPDGWTSVPHLTNLNFYLSKGGKVTFSNGEEPIFTLHVTKEKKDSVEVRVRSFQKVEGPIRAENRSESLEEHVRRLGREDKVVVLSYLAKHHNVTQDMARRILERTGFDYRGRSERGDEYVYSASNLFFEQQPVSPESLERYRSLLPGLPENAEWEEVKMPPYGAISAPYQTPHVSIFRNDGILMLRWDEGGKQKALIRVTYNRDIDQLVIENGMMSDVEIPEEFKQNFDAPSFVFWMEKHLVPFAQSLGIGNLLFRRGSITEEDLTHLKFTSHSYKYIWTRDLRGEARRSEMRPIQALEAKANMEFYMRQVIDLIDRRQLGVFGFPFYPVARIGAIIFDSEGEKIAEAVNDFGQQHSERLAVLNAFERTLKAAHELDLENARRIRATIDYLRILMRTKSYFPREELIRFTWLNKQLGEPMKDKIIMSSLEPCLRCADVIPYSGIKHVVFGNHDNHPDGEGSGVRILRAHGIEEENMRGGILAEEARRRYAQAAFLLQHFNGIYYHGFRRVHRAVYSRAAFLLHGARLKELQLEVPALSEVELSLRTELRALNEASQRAETRQQFSEQELSVLMQQWVRHGQGRIELAADDGTVFSFVYLKEDEDDRFPGIRHRLTVYQGKKEAGYAHFRQLHNGEMRLYMSFNDDSYHYLKHFNGSSSEFYDGGFLVTQEGDHAAIRVHDEAKKNYRGIGSSMLALSLRLSKALGATHFLSKHSWDAEFLVNNGFHNFQDYPTWAETVEDYIFRFSEPQETLPPFHIQRKTGVREPEKFTREEMQLRWTSNAKLTDEYTALSAQIKARAKKLEGLNSNKIHLIAMITPFISAGVMVGLRQIVQNPAILFAGGVLAVIGMAVWLGAEIYQYRQISQQLTKEQTAASLRLALVGTELNRRGVELPARTEMRTIPTHFQPAIESLTPPGEAEKILRPETRLGKKNEAFKETRVVTEDVPEAYQILFSQLERSLRHDARGQPPVLLISGVPGAGKSTLGKQFKKYLESQAKKAALFEADAVVRVHRQAKKQFWKVLFGAFLLGLVVWISKPDSQIRIFFIWMMLPFLGNLKARDQFQKTFLNYLAQLKTEPGKQLPISPELLPGSAAGNPSHLTSDTYVIIDGTMAEELFARIPVTKKLFLWIDPKIAYRQFIKRDLEEQGGGLWAARFRASAYSSPALAEWYRGNLIRAWDFVMDLNNRAEPRWLVRPENRALSQEEIAKASSEELRKALAVVAQMIVTDEIPSLKISASGPLIDPNQIMRLNYRLFAHTLKHHLQARSLTAPVIKTLHGFLNEIIQSYKASPDQKRRARTPEILKENLNEVIRIVRNHYGYSEGEESAETYALQIQQVEDSRQAPAEFSAPKERRKKARRPAEEINEDLRETLAAAERVDRWLAAIAPYWNWTRRWILNRINLTVGLLGSVSYLVYYTYTGWIEALKPDNEIEWALARGSYGLIFILGGGVTAMVAWALRNNAGLPGGSRAPRVDRPVERLSAGDIAERMKKRPVEGDPGFESDSNSPKRPEARGKKGNISKERKVQKISGKQGTVYWISWAMVNALPWIFPFFISTFALQAAAVVFIRPIALLLNHIMPMSWVLGLFTASLYFMASSPLLAGTVWFVTVLGGIMPEAFGDLMAKILSKLGFSNKEYFALNPAGRAQRILEELRNEAHLRGDYEVEDALKYVKAFQVTDWTPYFFGIDVAASAVRISPLLTMSKTAMRYVILRRSKMLSFHDPVRYPRENLHYAQLYREVSEFLFRHSHYQGWLYPYSVLDAAIHLWANEETGFKARFFPAKKTSELLGLPLDTVRREIEQHFLNSGGPLNLYKTAERYTLPAAAAEKLFQEIVRKNPAIQRKEIGQGMNLENIPEGANIFYFTPEAFSAFSILSDYGNAVRQYRKFENPIPRFGLYYAFGGLAIMVLTTPFLFAGFKLMDGMIHLDRLANVLTLSPEQMDQEYKYAFRPGQDEEFSVEQAMKAYMEGTSAQQSATEKFLQEHYGETLSSKMLEWLTWDRFTYDAYVRQGAAKWLADHGTREALEALETYKTKAMNEQFENYRKQQEAGQNDWRSEQQIRRTLRIMKALDIKAAEKAIEKIKKRSESRSEARPLPGGVGSFSFTESQEGVEIEVDYRSYRNAGIVARLMTRAEVTETLQKALIEWAQQRNAHDVELIAAHLLAGRQGAPRGEHLNVFKEFTHNALKAIEESKTHRGKALLRVYKKEGEIHFQFLDTGPGISREAWKTIGLRAVSHRPSNSFGNGNGVYYSSRNFLRDFKDGKILVWSQTGSEIRSFYFQSPQGSLVRTPVSYDSAEDRAKGFRTSFELIFPSKDDLKVRTMIRQPDSSGAAHSEMRMTQEEVFEFLREIRNVEGTNVFVENTARILSAKFMRLPLREGQKALVMGTGSSDYLPILLAKAGLEVSIYEPSERNRQSQIELQEQFVPGQVRSFGSEPSMENETFDHVFLMAVIHPAIQSRFLELYSTSTPQADQNTLAAIARYKGTEILAEAYSHLNPGGYLFVNDYVRRVHEKLRFDFLDKGEFMAKTWNLSAELQPLINFDDFTLSAVHQDETQVGGRQGFVFKVTRPENRGPHFYQIEGEPVDPSTLDRQHGIHRDLPNAANWGHFLQNYVPMSYATRWPQDLRGILLYLADSETIDYASIVPGAKISFDYEGDHFQEKVSFLITPKIYEILKWPLKDMAHGEMDINQFMYYLLYNLRDLRNPKNIENTFVAEERGAMQALMDKALPDSFFEEIESVVTRHRFRGMINGPEPPPEDAHSELRSVEKLLPLFSAAFLIGFSYFLGFSWRWKAREHSRLTAQKLSMPLDAAADSEEGRDLTVTRSELFEDGDLPVVIKWRNFTAGIPLKETAALQELEKNIPWYRRNLWREMENIFKAPDTVLVTAEHAETHEILGYVAALPQIYDVNYLHETADFPPREILYVISRQVLPAFQRQGIGKKLRRAMFEEAARLGYRYVSGHQTDKYDEAQWKDYLKTFGKGYGLALLKHGLRIDWRRRQRYVVELPRPENRSTPWVRDISQRRTVFHARKANDAASFLQSDPILDLLTQMLFQVRFIPDEPDDSGRPKMNKAKKSVENPAVVTLQRFYRFWHAGRKFKNAAEIKAYFEPMELMVQQKDGVTPNLFHAFQAKIFLMSGFIDEAKKELKEWWPKVDGENFAAAMSIGDVMGLRGPYSALQLQKLFAAMDRDIAMRELEISKSDFKDFRSVVSLVRSHSFWREMRSELDSAASKYRQKRDQGSIAAAERAKRAAKYADERIKTIERLYSLELGLVPVPEDYNAIQMTEAAMQAYRLVLALLSNDFYYGTAYRLLSPQFQTIGLNEEVRLRTLHRTAHLGNQLVNVVERVKKQTMGDVTVYEDIIEKLLEANTLTQKAIRLTGKIPVPQEPSPFAARLRHLIELLDNEIYSKSYNRNNWMQGVYYPEVLKTIALFEKLLIKARKGTFQGKDFIRLFRQVQTMRSLYAKPRGGFHDNTQGDELKEMGYQIPVLMQEFTELRKLMLQRTAIDTRRVEARTKSTLAEMKDKLLELKETAKEEEKRADAVREIVSYFKYDNAGAHEMTYAVLKYVPEVAPLLIPFVHDPNTLIAQNVILTLGFMHREQGQRRNSQNTLGQTETEIQKVLTGKKPDEEPEASHNARLRAAVTALGYMRTPAAIAALTKVWKSQPGENLRAALLRATAMAENPALFKEALSTLEIDEETHPAKIPFELAYSLNAQKVAGDLPTPVGKLLALRFGYIDQGVYTLLAGPEAGKWTPAAQQLMQKMGAVTENLLRTYVAQNESEDLLREWQAKQLVWMRTLMTEEVSMARMLSQITVAEGEEGTLERDLFFGILRETDWANTEDKNDTNPFGYSFREKHGGRFFYATRGVFEALWQDQLKKSDEIFKKAPPELAELLKPYYMIDALAVEMETREEPRARLKAILYARWTALSRILEIKDGQLRVPIKIQALADEDRIKIPLVRADLTNTEEVRKLISKAAMEKGLWKYALLSPDAVNATNRFMGRNGIGPDWRTLSYGSRSALKLYAYDLILNSGKPETEIRDEWQKVFKRLVEEEKKFRGLLPSLGMELQSTNVSGPKVYLWKNALPYFDIPSPDRLRYEHIVEPAFKPSWTPSAFLLAVPILHKLGLHERYKNQDAFHISLSGNLGPEARWLAFPLFAFRREKSEEELSPDAKASRMRWVMSKGYIHLNAQNEKADMDSAAPEDHTEIRTASLEVLDGQISPDYEKFLPAMQWMGAVLTAHEKEKTGATLSALENEWALLWEQYQKEMEQAIQQVPEAVELLKADWYQSTGDSKDPQLVKDLPIFDLILKFGDAAIWDDIPRRDAFRKQMQDLLLGYAEKAAEIFDKVRSENHSQEKILKDIQSALNSVPQSEHLSVLLFGSYADGYQHDGSDVDLILMIDESLSMAERRDIILHFREIEEALTRNLQSKGYRKIEFHDIHPATRKNYFDLWQRLEFFESNRFLWFIGPQSIEGFERHADGIKTLPRVEARPADAFEKMPRMQSRMDSFVEGSKTVSWDTAGGRKIAAHYEIYRGIPGFRTIHLYPDRETLRQNPELAILKQKGTMIGLPREGSFGRMLIQEYLWKGEPVLFIPEIQSSYGMHQMTPEQKKDYRAWKNALIAALVEQAKKSGYVHIFVESHRSRTDLVRPKTDVPVYHSTSLANVIEHYKRPFRRKQDGWNLVEVPMENKGFRPIPLWHKQLTLQEGQAETRANRVELRTAKEEFLKLAQMLERNDWIPKDSYARETVESWSEIDFQTEREKLAKTISRQLALGSLTKLRKEHPIDQAKIFDILGYLKMSLDLSLPEWFEEIKNADSRLERDTLRKLLPYAQEMVTRGYQIQAIYSQEYTSAYGDELGAESTVGVIPDFFIHSGETRDLLDDLTGYDAPTYMLRATHELVFNMIEHGKGGVFGIKVENGEVELAAWDLGEGIHDPERLRQESLKRYTGGLGFKGLSALQGSVTVESFGKTWARINGGFEQITENAEIERGTRLTVTMPLGVEVEPVITGKISSVGSPAGGADWSKVSTVNRMDFFNQPASQIRSKLLAKLNVLKPAEVMTVRLASWSDSKTSFFFKIEKIDAKKHLLHIFPGDPEKQGAKRLGYVEFSKSADEMFVSSFFPYVDAPTQLKQQVQRFHLPQSAIWLISQIAYAQNIPVIHEGTRNPAAFRIYSKLFGREYQSPSDWVALNDENAALYEHTGQLVVRNNGVHSRMQLVKIWGEDKKLYRVLNADKPEWVNKTVRVNESGYIDFSESGERLGRVAGFTDPIRVRGTLNERYLDYQGVRPEIRSSDLNHWMDRIEALRAGTVTAEDLDALTEEIQRRLKPAEAAFEQNNWKTFYGEHREKRDREIDAHWISLFINLAAAVLSSESPALEDLRRMDGIIQKWNENDQPRKWNFSLTLFLQLATNYVGQGETLKAMMKLAGNAIRLPGEYGYRMAAFTLFILGMHVKTALDFDGGVNEVNSDYNPKLSLALAAETIRTGKFRDDVPAELHEELLQGLKVGLVHYIYTSSKLWKYPSWDRLPEHTREKLSPETFKRVWPLQDFIEANRELLETTAQEIFTKSREANFSYILAGIPWFFNEILLPDSHEQIPPASWDRILLNGFNPVYRPWFMHFMTRQYRGKVPDIALVEEHKRYQHGDYAQGEYEALLQLIHDFHAVRPEIRLSPEILAGLIEGMNQALLTLPLEYKNIYQIRYELKTKAEAGAVYQAPRLQQRYQERGWMLTEVKKRENEKIQGKEVQDLVLWLDPENFPSEEVLKDMVQGNLESFEGKAIPLNWRLEMRKQAFSEAAAQLLNSLRAPARLAAHLENSPNPRIFKTNEKEAIYQEARAVFEKSGLPEILKKLGKENYALNVVSGLSPQRIAVHNHSDLDLSLSVEVQSKEELSQIAEAITSLQGLKFFGVEPSLHIVRFEPTSRMRELDVEETVDIFIQPLNPIPKDLYQETDLLRKYLELYRPKTLLLSGSAFSAPEARRKIAAYFETHPQNTAKNLRALKAEWLYQTGVDYYHLQIAGENLPGGAIFAPIQQLQEGMTSFLNSNGEAQPLWELWRRDLAQYVKERNDLVSLPDGRPVREKAQMIPLYHDRGDYAFMRERILQHKELLTPERILKALRYYQDLKAKIETASTSGIGTAIQKIQDHWDSNPRAAFNSVALTEIFSRPAPEIEPYLGMPREAFAFLLLFDFLNRSETREEMRPAPDAGIQKVARLSDGEGREVSVTRQELNDLRYHYSFAILALNRRTASVNAADKKAFETKLIKDGFAFMPVEGKYKGQPQTASYMVFNITLRKASSYASQLGQESFIYANKKTDGAYLAQPGRLTRRIWGHVTRVPDTQNYTVVHHPDGSSSTLGWHFSNKKRVVKNGPVQSFSPIGVKRNGAHLKGYLKSPRRTELRSVENMSAPVGVLVNAQELMRMESRQIDPQADELLAFLERHPGFDIYVDGTRAEFRMTGKWQKLFEEHSDRVHFGDRAGITQKKILVQVAFASGGSAAETSRTIQELKTRYQIAGEIYPLEYTQAGALKAFLDLAESKALSLLQQVSDSYAAFVNGRWRIAPDYLASIWTSLQNAYVIQWSA